MSSNGSNQQLRLSTSTWSLHRTLGDPVKYGPESGDHIPVETHGRGQTSLLELPARLKEFGISTLEICHFHLPSLDQGYLSELRGALEQAGVELFSLLIDEGDITHPVHGERDLQWVSNWIKVAGALGAKRTRVVAGKEPFSEETLERSLRAFKHLISLAEEQGLRLMTENWFGFLAEPKFVHTLFERLDGLVGLCFDFGNWGGPAKYENLRSIAKYAESCHTKAHFNAEGVIDKDDYVKCLDITKEAHFAGPYTLIYDGPDANEWAGLDIERQVVRPYLEPR
jgi:sugar phosphate isomerase/epimerase